MLPQLKKEPDGGFSYCKIIPKLSGMEPLITSWFKAIRRYCLWGEHDAPYWHGERANISLLSGAAWLSGAAVLEEYGTTKIFPAGDKGGRTDLYIKWPDGDDCVIEAKICWLPNNDLLAKMRSADNDARSNHDSATAYACTFIVPSHEKGEPWSPPEMIQKVTKLAPRLDILAALFPGRCTECTGDDGRIYPGIGIILNLIRP